jgi:hypothetical protein
MSALPLKNISICLIYNAIKKREKMKSQIADDTYLGVQAKHQGESLNLPFLPSPS